MKSKLLISYILLVFPFNLINAQKQIIPMTHGSNVFLQDRICGTNEILETMKGKDPDLEKRMRKIEVEIQRIIQTGNYIKKRVVVTIPVVFHIVYNVNDSANQNIPVSRIMEQMERLNIDFRKLNADTSNIPVVWKSIAADCEIEFCLAQQDPSGSPTSGITRTPTTHSSFSNSPYTDMCFDSMGGKDIWNRDKYLNIWVCDINTGGWSYYPGTGSDSVDGVVIKYSEIAEIPFSWGRTLVHEIGHWLNLIHIWGDDYPSTCADSDSVPDTPDQETFTTGFVTFPLLDACTPTPPGIMFMNHMDYMVESDRIMFTAGQKARMQATLSGFRSGLLTSNGCDTGIVSSVINVDPNVNISDDVVNINIYPNPLTAFTLIEFENYKKGKHTMTLYNSLGQLVLQIDNINERQVKIEKKSLTRGFYFFQLFNDTGIIVGNGKLIIE